MLEIGENNDQIRAIETQHSLQVLKNELENGVKEKIKEKTEGTTLNLAKSSSKEVKEILHFLIQNKNDFKELKLIIIPETFFYENDDHVKLLLDVLDIFEHISIKTERGFDIPRPPKSL